jgi:hypothetical protein
VKKKVKAASKRTSSIRETVASKSASLSPGKPAMTSVVRAISGRAAQATERE